MKDLDRPVGTPCSKTENSLSSNKLTNQVGSNNEMFGYVVKKAMILII